jgi:hypothetical protein
MLGQFPEWFAPGDGMVEEPPEPPDELPVDGVVAVVAVESAPLPLAALAIAAPPPMTAPATASVMSPSRSRCRI